MAKLRIKRRENSSSLITPIIKSRKFARRIITQHFSKVALNNARQYVNRFKSIVNLDKHKKELFLSRVRHHEIRFAKIDYWENLINTPANFIYIMTSLISFFVAPFLAKTLLNQPLDVYVFPAIILNILIFYILIMGALVLLEFLPSSFNFVVLFIPILILFALTLWFQVHGFYILTFLSASAILCQIIFTIALMFMVICSTLSETFGLGYLRRIYPDAYIIHMIIKLIIKLERNPNLWMDIHFRKELILDVEKTALCIEKDLFRNLKSGDKVSDHWLETIARQIATAFREKKFWILTPKVDTYDYLIRNLLDSLINLVEGNWDALEKKEPEKISFKQTWFDFMKNTIKVIVVGGIPIFALFLIQNSSLALVVPFRDYAIGGAILWALFTTITTLDPLFDNKISAIKEIINLLPLINKIP